MQALTAYQNLYATGIFDKGVLSLKEADADNQFNARLMIEAQFGSGGIRSGPHRLGRRFT